LATYAVPIVPDAPDRFSTTNGWPSESESFAAIRRAIGSVDPPGGYGTTNFTGLVGQACAQVVIGASAASAIAATRRTERIMIPPFPNEPQVTTARRYNPRSSKPCAYGR